MVLYYNPSRPTALQLHAGKPLKLAWLNPDLGWPAGYTIPMFVVDLLTRIEDAYHPVDLDGEGGREEPEGGLELALGEAGGSGSGAVGARSSSNSITADATSTDRDSEPQPGGLRRRGALQLKVHEASEHLVAKRREEDEEQLWHQAHEMKPLTQEEARSREMMWFAFGSQLAFVVVCIVLKWLDI